jgi:hypothetical protein
MRIWMIIRTWNRSIEDPLNDLVLRELLREMIDDGFLILQSRDILIRTSD